MSTATIAYRDAGGRVTASFYYRNDRGQRRRIEATADSKTAARRLALAKLELAISGGAASGVTPRTTFEVVARQWHAHIVDLVDAGQRSPTTAALYRSVLELHVLPAIGRLQLAELSAARVDNVIHRLRHERGYAVAKLCRSIVSGVCGFAVRCGGMRSNPVRDAGRLESNARPARALTPAECVEWLALLDADARARQMDLPDLVRFLLATGVRLGEALGVTWDDIDLDRRLIHVRRTIVRVKGRGLIAKQPKTRSGSRTLRIPIWLADLLRQREDAGPATGPLFPDARGGYRDLNNVEREFRRARAGTPFHWVVPHTYRKTVATVLDRNGLTARLIADQLGHARVSMTQDVYLGRRAVDDAAADALDVTPFAKTPPWTQRPGASVEEPTEPST